METDPSSKRVERVFERVGVKVLLPRKDHDAGFASLRQPIRPSLSEGAHLKHRNCAFITAG